MGSGRGDGDGEDRSSRCCECGYCLELAWYFQCFIFVGLVMGPILMGFGIHFLVQAGAAVRETSVAQYNSAVQVWTTTYRAQLTNAAFSFAGAALASRSSGDVLDDAGQDINRDYEQLHFYVHTTLPAPGTPMVIDADNGGRTSELIVTAHANRTYDLEPIDMDSCHKTSDQCGSAPCTNNLCSATCASRNGTWTNDSYCRVVTYLHAICAAVLLDAGGYFVPDNTRSLVDFGCYYEGSMRAGDPRSEDPGLDTWFIGVYRTYPPAGLDVQVRSAYDPYIVASEVTLGRYHFGFSTGDKLAVGLPLLIIGMLLIIAITIFTVVSVRRLARKETGRSTRPTPPPDGMAGQPPSYTPMVVQPTVVVGSPMMQQPMMQQPMMQQPMMQPAGQPVINVHLHQNQGQRPQDPQAMHAQMMMSDASAQQAYPVAYAQQQPQYTHMVVGVPRPQQQPQQQYVPGVPY